jgi:DNA-binding winged helix-turn-helix (wHTH) protein
MMNLRDKLESIGYADLVKTVVRAGYVIESES